MYTLIDFSAILCIENYTSSRKTGLKKTKLIIMTFYSMTNGAIAQELGQRIEKLRLELNITQQNIADEVGLTRVSYRKLIQGKAKFENIIAVLRVLGKLDLVEHFIPETTLSPMQQLKMKGKQRQRAKSSSKSNSPQPNTDKELDW